MSQLEQGGPHIALEVGYRSSYDMAAATQRQQDLEHTFAGFVALNLDPDTMQHHYGALEHGGVTTAERQACIGATPDTLPLRTLIAGMRARAEVSAAYASVQEATPHWSGQLPDRHASPSGTSRYETYRIAERQYAAARQTWLNALAHQQEAGIPNLDRSQSLPVTVAFDHFMHAGRALATAHHALRTALAPKSDGDIDVAASRQFVTTTWHAAKARQAAKHYWHDRLSTSVRTMAGSLRDFTESLGNIAALYIPWKRQRRHHVRSPDVEYRFV
jgi:hypothetical protein